MTTLVVVGDVHGNAHALRAALARARAGPMDAMVLVGDLLTYGHDVDEVLALVADAQRRDGAVVLVGNHDQMYFDCAEGARAPYDKLPPWIQDSVGLTLDKLAGRRLRDQLAWSEEYFADGVLVAHANAFGAGDYRYLVDDAAAEATVAALAARGAVVGVFGHTHRPRWGGCSAAKEPPLDQPVTANLATPLVVNAGAVGQPRDARARSVILRISVEPGQATGTFEAIDYDVEAHLETLRRAGLPERTVSRLCGFFRPGGSANVDGAPGN